MQIFSLRVLETNYTYFIQSESGVIVVDPGDYEPVRRYLDQHQLTVIATLLTHKHWDHTQGVEALQAYQPHPVYGGSKETFPFEVVAMDDNQVFELDQLQMTCLHLPGHTSGGCGYLVGDCLFTGDVLFGAGMGRLFEGDAKDMLPGLNRICTLPDETQIYFGHEYTVANLAFAETVEPNNLAIQQRIQQLKKLGSEQTTPSTLGVEKKTNPFLRVHEPAVKQAIELFAGQTLDTPEACLQMLREWKNQYDEGAIRSGV
ncbi:MAG: hydroxyacylglutathione hydrolase [Pseudomonadota bacterium]|nr:hydroxyacylglutathione hydrolase [Pseudomonadota bacterium]